jgi:hypothetical protein
MASGDLTGIYRQGYGQAYILPENGAVDTLLDGLDRNTVLRQRNADMAAKRKMEADSQFNDNIKKLTPGDYYTKYSDHIQNGYNELVKNAIGLKSQGTDPFTNTEFLNKYESLKADARASNEIKKSYEDFWNKYSKEPERFDNGLDILNQYQNLSINDYKEGKFNPPQLQRSFSVADAVKASNGEISYIKRNDGTYDTTSVNRSGNVGQAINSIATPEAQYLIGKYGGDTGPYSGGFPTVTDDGKTYYNTKGRQFEDAVIAKLATDPNFPTVLANKGYDTSTTAAIKKSALDYAKKQNEATGKYVKEYADLLENKATTDVTRVFTAESNRRANREAARAEERLAHDKKKWAEEELEKKPDDIATNVLTNVASSRTNGEKVAQRPSTSLAAVNVGDAKTPFLPQVVFDAETGMGAKNSASVSVNGGQIHIKPILNFDGGRKILDDESLENIRKGTYKLNCKTVPKDAVVSYEELLYGTEKVEADPNDPLSKSSSRKIIIPIAGQAIDNKFSKKYDRQKMYDAAIKSSKDFETKKDVVKQYLKTQAPNLSEKDLDKLAFETAKQY